MASISKDRDRNGKHNGCRTIQFIDGEGKRRSVRLGKMTQRRAEDIRGHVDSILASNFAGDSYERAAAEWLGRIDPKFREKLAAAGLIAQRQSTKRQKLGEFLDSYIETRQRLKPASVYMLKYARKAMLEFWGANRRLNTITEGDADLFREHLTGKFSENTVRTHCNRARQFFAAAVKHELIKGNPFAGMGALRTLENRDRARFIQREVIDAVIETCPDVELRLIIALARYGGLRTPSEPLAMKWGDVDWDRERLTVRCVKTERHEGKAFRVIPIFPEIMPHLEAVYHEPGRERTEHVILRHRLPAKSIARRMQAAIKAAGVEPWPKLFHNLRSTRETELMEQYPPHVVCKWVGHDITVAARHYLQTTDAYFDRALQKCMQPPAAVECQGSK